MVNSCAISLDDFLKNNSDIFISKNSGNDSVNCDGNSDLADTCFNSSFSNADLGSRASSIAGCQEGFA